MLKVKNLIISPGKPVICAPIVGKTVEEIILIIRRIHEEKVDLAEWRVDYFQDIEDEIAFRSLLKLVLKELKGMPYIFTFRTKEEGGQIRVTKEWYINLLRKVCEDTSADIIDIEINTLEEDSLKELVAFAKEKDVKVIISSHDFEKTPDKTTLVKQMVKMQDLGADIAKLAVMPRNINDLLTLLAATEDMYTNHAKIPLVTMSMDKMGFLSRISGEIFGSAISFATVTKASAPGQIPVKDLYNILELIHRNIKEKQNNIMFIGFMGTGKTSITKALSDMTNMKMVDTDEYIENKEGMSISEIFRQHGEGYFRDLETEAIVEILKEKDQLISCGGGMILRDENVKHMKDRGKIILLTASTDEIAKRVKKDKKRPLINEGSGRREIEDLYESRKSKYLKAADIIVDTTNKTIEELCIELIEKFL